MKYIIIISCLLNTCFAQSGTTTIDGQPGWPVFTVADSSNLSTKAWVGNDGKDHYRNNPAYPYATHIYQTSNGVTGNIIPTQASIVKEFTDAGYRGQGIKVLIADFDFYEYNGLHFAGSHYDALTFADDDAWVGHGSQIASVIGEKPNGHVSLGSPKPNGIEGIAYEASLYAARRPDTGYISMLQYGEDIGADVICIAGSTYPDPVKTAKIKEAISKGAIVICAAGNGSFYPKGPIDYPASIPGVIAVTGMMGGHILGDKDSSTFGNILPSAMTGKSKSVDFALPSWIIAKDKDYGWSANNGTSLDVPILAGYIAVVQSYFLKKFGMKLTPCQMLNWLTKHSTNIGFSKKLNILTIN